MCKDLNNEISLSNKKKIKLNLKLQTAMSKITKILILLVIDSQTWCAGLFKVTFYLKQKLINRHWTVLNSSLKIDK